MASFLLTIPDLPRQLKWYEIRDTLLGQNYVRQDVKQALELAAVCSHQDARSLTDLFAGKDVKTEEEARLVFLAQGDDACSLCFAELVSKNGDESCLRRSAQLGYALAQACMANRTSGENLFNFASQAASQRERDGFYWLAYCYQYSYGCVVDLDKARENYLLAAKLGHVNAMTVYGLLLKDSDPQRWYWWSRAAARGKSVWFLDKFSEQVERFSCDTSLAPVVLAIGRALKGHLNDEKQTIFGESGKYDSLISPANRAIDFFSSQLSAARKAVNTWCMIACRVGNNILNRDVRKKIGEMIWEAREQAEYKQQK
jgi:TPR repeat protein